MSRSSGSGGAWTGWERDPAWRSPRRGRSGSGRGRRWRPGRELALIAASQLGAGLPDRVLERVGEGRRRGLGAFEGEPVGLELLDEAAHLTGVDHAVELQAELASTDLRVRLAPELRHDQPPDVADRARLDVLVRALDLGDGCTVHAALVG